MHSDLNMVDVIKMNRQREETWRYQGRILARDKNSILIEAFFNRSDLMLHDIILRENDRFIERYYDDQWFNIFEIHDRDDGHLKGWYCNVTTPAEFTPGKIAYIDLALDLLAYPNGSYIILDRDEFNALNLSEKCRTKALQALNSLIALAKAGNLRNAVNNNKETR